MQDDNPVSPLPEIASEAKDRSCALATCAHYESEHIGSNGECGNSGCECREYISPNLGINPCPFCGDDAVLVDENQEGTLWWVGCANEDCGMQARTETGGTSSIQSLKYDWNRRPTPSPVPLGEGASEATEVWLVEFRSDVYPEWTSWHFEFYQSEEDADSEVQELRQGKAGLAHSRSEFRATRYAALASKAVPIPDDIRGAVGVLASKYSLTAGFSDELCAIIARLTVQAVPVGEGELEDVYRFNTRYDECVQSGNDNPYVFASDYDKLKALLLQSIQRATDLESDCCGYCRRVEALEAELIRLRSQEGATWIKFSDRRPAYNQKIEVLLFGSVLSLCRLEKEELANDDMREPLDILWDEDADQERSETGAYWKPFVAPGGEGTK